MALFDAEGEMAKRGVQMTLLNHHVELKDPARPYDEGSVLMGLFIVGPFDIPRTRIIPPEEHIFWGHAHPKEKTRTQCACGYLATSYVGQQPPAPKMFSLDGLNQALAEVQQAKREYERGNEECAQASGIAPWNPVVMPNWSLRWREDQERRPEQRFLDEHTMSGKVGINSPSQSRTFRATDDFDPLPPCQEIIAKSRWWDTYGARRGRGGHWPTIVSIGRAPHRSVAQRKKRAAKKANARKRQGSSDGCAGGWRRQQASSSCEPYKQPRGSGQPRRAQWWGVTDQGWGANDWRAWIADAAWSKGSAAWTAAHGGGWQEDTWSEGDDVPDEPMDRLEVADQGSGAALDPSPSAPKSPPQLNLTLNRTHVPPATLSTPDTVAPPTATPVQSPKTPPPRPPQSCGNTSARAEVPIAYPGGAPAIATAPSDPWTRGCIPYLYAWASCSLVSADGTPSVAHGTPSVSSLSAGSCEEEAAPIEPEIVYEKVD